MVLHFSNPFTQGCFVQNWLKSIRKFLNFGNVFYNSAMLRKTTAYYNYFHSKNILPEANVIQTMDKSEQCLVPIAWHTSAVSHVTCVNIELLDQTLKIPVVFGKICCYRRKDDCLFYLKIARCHLMLFVKYSQFWLESLHKLKMRTDKFSF